jgi:hypothetical protein
MNTQQYLEMAGFNDEESESIIQVYEHSPPHITLDVLIKACRKPLPTLEEVKERLKRIEEIK